MATMVSEKKSRRKKKKGGSRRRRRRSNPGTAPARQSRRRRNPSFSSIMSGSYGIGDALKEGVPMLAGQVFSSWVVKRFGSEWGPGMLTADQLNSPYAGKGWSLMNYGLGLLASNIGGRMVGRAFGEKAGQAFWRGGLHNMMTRFFYTEIIGRSKWAQDQFGAVPGQWVGVYDDGSGNRYAMMEGSEFQPSMMGLEVAGPMGDSLSVAGPYGRLQFARPIDRRQGRGGRRYAQMGHALVEGPERRHAAMMGSGTDDLYAAAYGFQG